MTSTPTHEGDRDRPLVPTVDPRDAETETSDDLSTEPGGTPLQDWIEAENSRPTLPEETADGLDETEEEIRHQAEDLPLDTPGRD